MQTDTDPWTIFSSCATTLGPSPGIREEWARGRARYAVWLLRLSHPEIEARVRSVALALGDAIEPLPTGDLHITVAVAGFPAVEPRWEDDVSLSVLASQRAALRRLRLSPLRLWVGGVSSFASAPFLEVRGGEGLSRLRALLGPTVAEAYHPHVTVGVYRDHRPAAPIRAALAAYRGLPLLEVRVCAVDLVTFRAQEASAPLETRWRVCCTHDHGDDADLSPVPDDALGPDPGRDPRVSL